MNYERALIEAKKGKAIIFFGAGFSFGLKSAFGKDLPTGSGLARILCEEVNSSPIDDLKKATKRYLKSKSSENLIDLLKDHFIVNDVDDKYKKIASIPWKSVYTTNYDNSFEIAAQLVGKRFESFDTDTNPRGKVLKNSVIHINGYIGNLNDIKLETSFKLTTPSYLTEQFRLSVWSEVFRRDIQAANAIFFVGYSLYDIDIQEILFAESELKKKIFFIDRINLTKEEIEDLDISDFGTVLPIGIDKFANDFDNVDILAGLESEELIINNFEKIEIESNNIVKVKDTDIFNLLINGEIKDELLINEVTKNESDYVVSREQENIAFGDLKENKNLILYGDLSNGKTITAKTIAYRLLREGYEVFVLNDFYVKESVYNEVDDILKRFEKVIFIIENYTVNMDVVSHINISRNINTKMLLTSRTFEHERYIDDILFNKRQLDVNETFEEPIDKISEIDIEKFIIYLDRYGLWGVKSNFNYVQKRNYIRRKANNEIHGILLGILESTSVKSKIEILFKEMMGSEIILRNILAILCLNISNVNKVTHHLVSAMTNDSSIFSSTFREKSIFYQLVNENKDGLFPKSSILSEYILENFPNPEILVNNLIILCKNIHSRSLSRNDVYMQIYKDLASFRYAQKVLPKRNKRESLINFYEGLREIDQERKNPHFWLQYAIARLSFSDKDNLNIDNLSYVNHHLETALALAKAIPNYWTDDIDTQYARYYIELAKTHTPENVDLAFNDFIKAYELILKIHKGGRYKKEIVRPITFFDKFYQKFSNYFNDEQCAKLESYCDNILKIISNYPTDIRVLKANRILNDIIKDLKFKKHIKVNK
ncbi:SIR2 family protein [Acinetobacter bereziniae]|uniref:Novel STAND NTPase 3 domain-containing protein n=1 Tax=Acinetobacter bereziniae NIPH 3 TaxID=1217651 RepID=N8YM94_ACIBZ|nr:SIR2 family protein [Acinetobacter bereziniae]ENV20375.1 hypothetical protein F963_03660 [Acinetobacter bereziniae NIPH 3]